MVAVGRPKMAHGEPPKEMETPQKRWKPPRGDVPCPGDDVSREGAGRSTQDAPFQPGEQGTRHNQQLKPAHPLLFLLAVSSSGPYSSDWDALNATPGMGLDGAEEGQGGPRRASCRKKRFGGPAGSRAPSYKM